MRNDAESRPRGLVAVGQAEMSRHNRARALGIIWDNGMATRSELAKALGLTKPAMTRIVQELVEARFVHEVEAKHSPGRGGRPGTYLAFTSGAHSFVGIDLRAYRGLIQVKDLDGSLLHEKLLDLGPEADPAHVVTTTTDWLRGLGSSIPPVRGIGVSVPGRIEPDQRTLAHAIREQWAHFPLVKRLEEALGPGWPSPQLHHLCGCGALGNWRHSPSHREGATLMHLQVGLGAGLGRVTQSMRSTLLDLRFVDVAHLPMDPDGPECTCGARGCLDAVAGLQALAALARRTGLELGAGPLGVDDFSQALSRLAEDGDDVAIAAIEKVATYLGRAIAMINNIDPPDYFTIGGYPALLGPVFETAFLAAAEPYAPDIRAKVLTDTLGDKATVAGAVALGMTTAFADPLATLDAGAEGHRTGVPRESLPLSPRPPRAAGAHA